MLLLQSIFNNEPVNALLARRVSLESCVCQTTYRWSDFTLFINKEVKNCWTWIKLAISDRNLLIKYSPIPQTTARNCWFYPGTFFIYRQCKIRSSICCLANAWPLIRPSPKHQWDGRPVWLRSTRMDSPSFIFNIKLNRFLTFVICGTKR